MVKKIFLSCLFLLTNVGNAMLKIGHRGACGYEPENTLRSFKKAIELGVDMIELDVYVCKSGELVVIHDDKVGLTTNGQGLVTEKTVEELKTLDAGKGETIPTLQEVFDLVDRTIKINIELKGENTTRPVAQLIKEYVQKKGWMYADFFVSSFDHHEVMKFKKLCPQVKTGAIIEGIPIDYTAFAQKAQADVAVLCINRITQAYVDDAHERNLHVYVYTANDSDEIQQLKSLGVDGLISNFPDRL